MFVLNECLPLMLSWTTISCGGFSGIGLLSSPNFKIEVMLLSEQAFIASARAAAAFNR